MVVRAGFEQFYGVNIIASELAIKNGRYKVVCRKADTLIRYVQPDARRTAHRVSCNKLLYSFIPDHLLVFSRACIGIQKSC